MARTRLIASLLLGVAGTLDAQPTAIDSVALARQSNLHYRNFSYWGKEVQWSSPRIAVCWENPTAADEQERKWARDAVIRTWEKQSAVRFDGWGPCAASTKGVRIRIADEWPQAV